MLPDQEYSTKELDVIEEYFNILSTKIYYNHRYKYGSLSDISLNLVLIGNSDIQKETIARAIGYKYHKLELLENEGFVKISDIKYNEINKNNGIQLFEKKLQKAIGEVLLIDNIDCLLSLGVEAFDKLIYAMEKYKGQLAVIVIGNQNEIERFFKVNTAIEHHYFPYIIHINKN